MLFSDKKILLGVSGGIAAYKSCELIRELRRQGASVRVMMTPSAREFITPLTFAALSEHPVLCSIFPEGGSAEIAHIDWARWGDVIVVCPATANTIARLALGFADEPVSTTIRATRVPVVICPAMNAGMWEDKIVQANISRLREIGYRIVDPEFGSFATTAEGEGWGRLARSEWILLEIRAALQQSQPLRGKKILVTAGRTEEYIDPVRMITNPATGRMGFALAEAALVLGGNVTLIHGPTSLAVAPKIHAVPIVSAADMTREVIKHYDGTDILIMAAAVADHRPRHIAKEKIKKDAALDALELEPTEDILKLVGAKKQAALHVGFAVETENEVANAQRKLHAKKLDMIVLNNPRMPGVGFGTLTNQVTLMDSSGSVEPLALMSKNELAVQILQRLLTLRPPEGASPAPI